MGAGVRRVTVSARRGEWTAYVWSSLPGALLAMLTGIWVSEPVAMAVFAVSFVGLNLMHMGATWSRVYVRPGWRVRPVERLTVPVGLAAFALLYEAIGGGALLLALQYFLSFHHALMQNYGLLRVSQRRSGRVVDARLDLAACLLLPGAALLYRAGIVCDRYAGALVPSLPLPLIAAMAGLGAAALIAFAWREWRSHRRGEPVEWIGCGLVLGTNMLWSGLLVANPHPALPLYALASGHYAQYLYFVWNVEARDRAPAPAHGMRGLVSATLRSSRVRYLVVLLGLGGSVALLLTGLSVGLRQLAEALQLRPAGALDIAPWAAAMIGINLEHYWLDHRIWRAPRPAAVASTA